MEATPSMILKSRASWLIAIWIACAFLPEVVIYLRWQFPMLKEFPMFGLAVGVFASAVVLTARLISCPVCKHGLPKGALNLQNCPHCGTDYNRRPPHDPIS
jgi:hypothetical protein